MAIARCVYCGTTLEPNSMYCLGCGQLVSFAREEDEPVDDGWVIAEPAPRPAPVPAQEVPLAAPLSDTRAAPPRAEGHPASVTEQRWSDRIALAFSTGERVVIAGSAVIGRKPEQTAANLGAQAIEVDDDTRSVSRVHLFLDLADGQLRAGDAGSSNGSVLQRGERMIPLVGGGERVTVIPGDVLHVGDVRLDITPAS